MPNALKWIHKKAKELQKKHPREKWTSLIKKAGAAYRAGHRAASTVKRHVKRRTVKVRRRRVSKISAIRPPGARIVKHRKSGGSQPIAWHVVKLHEMGFRKSGRNYVTLGAHPRRIVWQTWDAKEAKAYLKKHCLHDR